MKRNIITLKLHQAILNNIFPFIRFTEVITKSQLVILPFHLKIKPAECHNIRVIPTIYHVHLIRFSKENIWILTLTNVLHM